MKERLACLAVAGAALAFAGCGTQQSSDVFLVKRTGKIPGANLTLLVIDDGSVQCNGGKPKPLSNELLLKARDLNDQLAKDQSKPIPAIGVVNPIYNFTVTSGWGSISWEDGNPGVPESFKQLAYFTRQVAKKACGLKR
jgi:hypothetical protein